MTKVRRSILHDRLTLPGPRRRLEQSSHHLRGSVKLLVREGTADLQRVEGVPPDTEAKPREHHAEKMKVLLIV